MNILRVALLPLAWVYGALATVRNILYDAGILRATGAEVPVISVGNLTAGGSGKTPIVEHIVNLLLAGGVRVGVVSRGYKRVTRGTVVVSDGRTILATAVSGGDEPVQIARKFPSACVVVDENRARGAECAVRKLGVEAIVLDDGFQHRSLRRDLDLVVVDADHPPHDAWMLPAGLLREPVGGLNRAGAVVVSRWSEDKGPRASVLVREKTAAPQFRAWFRVKSVVRLADGARLPVGDLKGKPFLAFCGIARPERFRKTLEEAGLSPGPVRFFPDHYLYSRAELADLERECMESRAEGMITTEKDAMRVADGAKDFVSHLPLYYVELETCVVDAEEFSQLILSIARK